MTEYTLGGIRELPGSILVMGGTKERTYNKGKSYEGGYGV